MNIRIEPCRDAHILASLNEDVQQLHRELYPESFKPFDYTTVVADFDDFLRRDGSQAIVAWISDKPVGFALLILAHHPDTAYRPAYDFLLVEQMSVRPKHRHQGIGTRLLQRVKEIARELRVHRIELTVWENNTGAVEFYDRAGFVPFLQRRHMDLPEEKLP